jgi:hypothetical protein
MPIQIILVLLFVLAIVKVISRFRNDDITGKEMAMWIAFWLCAIVIVVKPDSTFTLARLVGVQRGADVVVYGAITLIFFILFRFLIRMEKQQKEITVLTREIALLRKESDSEKKF